MASRRPLIVNSSAGQIQELTDSDSLIGNGTIPIGGIIMWSGTIAEIANLSGWELCDGNNGTPDLRDRFVIGATTDGSDNTFPGLSVDQSGGSADAVVVSHSHTASTDTEPNHTHPLSRQSGTNNVNTQSGRYALATDNDAGVDNTGGGGAHDHTVTVDSEGVAGTNQNLPPWYALAFIMRTI